MTQSNVVATPKVACFCGKSPKNKYRVETSFPSSVGKSGTVYDRIANSFHAKFFVLDLGFIHIYDNQTSTVPGEVICLEGLYVDVISDGEHLEKYGFRITFISELKCERYFYT
jgi:hypothetical protein